MKIPSKNKTLYFPKINIKNKLTLTLLDLGLMPITHERNNYFVSEANKSTKFQTNLLDIVK